MQKIIVR